MEVSKVDKLFVKIDSIINMNLLTSGMLNLDCPDDQRMGIFSKLWQHLHNKDLSWIDTIQSVEV
jgi:hypothetical protein